MPDAAVSPPPPADPATQVRALERERRHLLALVEILQQTAGVLNFVDIVQAVTRGLGDTFGLDRCSIFLRERDETTARLVASYEDPTIRNYVVDLERYPELKRALQSGETVFIADAQSDPNLQHIRGALANRKVKTITVVPITWRRVVIGAIFLRTFREGATFSDDDIQFTQTVGAITAKALRAAYRYEKAARRPAEQSDAVRRADLERIALLAFLRRLLASLAKRQGAQGEDRLGHASSEEIDRLVEIAVAVLAEEGKGR
ncbi:MAG TPA: GAF domain-containing protein [Gemmatimonadales bacterium]|nr:GAF domain-containing protein [Gemmatimonadales bacterium]